MRPALPSTPAWRRFSNAARWAWGIPLGNCAAMLARICFSAAEGIPGAGTHLTPFWSGTWAGSTTVEGMSFAGRTLPCSGGRMKPPPLEALLMMAWLPAPAAQARGSGNGRPGGKPAAAGTVTVFTVAPGGGVKGKLEAAGRVNDREV